MSSQKIDEKSGLDLLISFAKHIVLIMRLIAWGKWFNKTK